MKIATIKTFVRATGWKPTTRNPHPLRENYVEVLDLARKKGVSIHHDGRAYVPFQPFVRRSLRKNPKDAGRPMAQSRLTQDAIECLAELGEGIGKPCFAEHTLLAKRGLIEINTGRFGAYTRITEAGRTYLGRMPSRAGRAGPKPRGPGGTRGVQIHDLEAATRTAAEVNAARSDSLRGAGTRTSRTPAKQAMPHGQKRR